VSIQICYNKFKQKLKIWKNPQINSSKASSFTMRSSKWLTGKTRRITTATKPRQGPKRTQNPSRNRQSHNSYGLEKIAPLIQVNQCQVTCSSINQKVQIFHRFLLLINKTIETQIELLTINYDTMIKFQTSIKELKEILMNARSLIKCFR
jgi:hypothetical protein